MDRLLNQSVLLHACPPRPPHRPLPLCIFPHRLLLHRAMLHQVLPFRLLLRRLSRRIVWRSPLVQHRRRFLGRAAPLVVFTTKAATASAMQRAVPFTTIVVRTTTVCVSRGLWYTDTCHVLVTMCGMSTLAAPSVSRVRLPRRLSIKTLSLFLQLTRTAMPIARALFTR